MFADQFVQCAQTHAVHIQMWTIAWAIARGIALCCGHLWTHLVKPVTCCKLCLSPSTSGRQALNATAHATMAAWKARRIAQASQDNTEWPLGSR